MISKIDNNGNINGRFLIFNHKQSRYGIRKEIGDIHFEKEDALLDSFVFITKDYGDSCTGYSFDGIYRKVIKKETLGE